MHTSSGKSAHYSLVIFCLPINKKGSWKCLFQDWPQLSWVVIHLHKGFGSLFRRCFELRTRRNFDSLFAIASTRYSAGVLARCSTGFSARCSARASPTSLEHKHRNFRFLVSTSSDRFGLPSNHYQLNTKIVIPDFPHNSTSDDHPLVPDHFQIRYQS